MLSAKQFGIVFVVVGVILALLAFSAKTKEDFYIDALVEAHGGVCILENDYCLHNDRVWTGYIIAWSLGAVLVLFGVYLFFFDRSFEEFRSERQRFAAEVRKASRKDEFSAFLSGFSEDERAVLKAVHEQDGITQSTLRYRTGLSKATLSQLLSSFEERDIVRRKPAGKTKQVFLRKKY